jgi:hypothetical protein
VPFPPEALGGPAPSRARFGIEERYLSKQNALEEAPGVEREQEHHVSALAVTRLSRRVLLLGRLGWVTKQIREEPIGEAASAERSRGLGDAEISALARLREFSLGGERAALLSLTGGVRIPTGSSQLRDPSGERRDEHLQPGTGAWSGLLGADLLLPLSWARLELNGSYRRNGTNRAGYRYGDAVLYNLGVARRLGSVLELSMQLNGRVAAQDREGDGILGANSGGHVLYASPALRGFAGAGLMLEAGAQFPFASDLHGDQEEHATARFALSLAR